MRVKQAALLFVALLAIANDGRSQIPLCEVNGAIPCVVEWSQLSGVPGRTQSFGHAAAILGSGEALTPGSSLNSEYVDRDVFKFARDGTPIYWSGIPGVPWYLGSSSAEDWAQIIWQKIILDEPRGRFFVLFAATPPATINANYFFLAAHDLATGEKLPTWGGTKFVGFSQNLEAGFDFDGNGDVWTIVGDGQFSYLKKWQTSTGTNVTPSNVTPPTDYTLIGQPNQWRRLQAFGIRKSDSKMFIAFEESANDSVVTLWDANIQFLGRHNYSKELTAPSSIPAPGGCCGTGLLTDHPYLSDGYVDGQGSLVLAGTYRFKRQDFEFEEYYTFPVVLRFGVNAAGNGVQPGPEFYENQHPAEIAAYVAPDRLAVTVVGTPTGDTYVRLRDLEQIVYLISNTPAFRAYVWLPNPYGGQQGPAGCRYQGAPAVTGMYFRDNRLVLSGTVTKLGNPCGGEDPTAFTISYRRALNFKCCVTRPFAWDFERFAGFWYHWQHFPPPPPDPCPRCSKFERRARNANAGRVPGSLVRDVGLIASTRPAPEFPTPILERLAKTFASIPVGSNFTEARQKDILDQLKTAGRDGRSSTKLSAALLETTNAALLDRALGKSATTAPVQKGRQVAKLGRATATFSDVASPGKLDLRVRPGLPAFVDGMDPVLPVGTFEITFDGKIAPKSTIDWGFDLEQFTLPSGATAVHVLQSDGGAYRDVTTAFNADRNYVTARTDRLGQFVFMVSYARARQAGTK